MRLQQLLYIFACRMRALFRRRDLDDNLDDEFQFHLEMRIAQEIASGKTPENAHYAARSHRYSYGPPQICHLGGLK
jgi:hypothetical protein